MDEEFDDEYFAWDDMDRWVRFIVELESRDIDYVQGLILLQDYIEW